MKSLLDGTNVIKLEYGTTEIELPSNNDSAYVAVQPVILITNGSKVSVNAGEVLIMYDLSVIVTAVIDAN